MTASTAASTGLPASPAAVAAANDAASGIDIERLVQPIAGPSPAGVSLRYDAAYDQIREARRDEDPTLPQGVWRRDVKRANWSRVIELCGDALSNRSKDLQIAGWLVEALVQNDGFAGLTQGCRALTALCDAFWPDLFPEIDDGDLSARIAPLEWLKDKLPPVLYTLPLTHADTTDEASYSWTDYANAQRQDLARGADARVPPGTLTLHEFFESAADTPTRFYEDMAGELALCLDATATLGECLQRWCGREAPSLAQLNGALENIQGFVNALLAQRDDKTPPAPALPVLVTTDTPELAPGAQEEAGELPAAPVPARIQIRNRDEAYRLLTEIADYLFTVEPHSPTPYIVQRAASWGSMPLHKLLVELTKGNNDLTALFELLGLGAEGSPFNLGGGR